MLSANCVLIASGVSYRQISAPGFAELTGAGVYYGAAMTEARSCSDQHVVVIGGANSAGQAAVHFSGYARQVTMLVRGSSLEKSMSQYLVEQIAALDNVAVRTGSSAVAAEGQDGRLRRLRVHGPAGEDEEEALDVDACFVFMSAARSPSRRAATATARRSRSATTARGFRSRSHNASSTRSSRRRRSAVAPAWASRRRGGSLSTATTGRWS